MAYDTKEYKKKCTNCGRMLDVQDYYQDFEDHHPAYCDEFNVLCDCGNTLVVERNVTITYTVNKELL